MLERKRTRGANKVIRLSLLIVFVGVLISVIVVFNKYQSVFTSNVELKEDHIFFYIPTGSTYDEVYSQIIDLNILINKKSFKWVSNRKEYPSNVKAGRYRIKDGMNNNELVNMLRAGNQEPVMVIFNNLRTLDQLAGKVSKYLECDSIEMAEHLRKPELPMKYGLNEATFMAMFIPNTYEMYWTSTPMEFTNRMAMEYEKFWEKRDKKLAHWRKVAISACEQSGRNIIPEVVETTTLDKLDLMIKKEALKLVLTPETNTSLRQINFNQTATSNNIVVFIGPEGGLTDEEVSFLKKNQFTNIRFGPRILRTETAGPAVISALQTLWGDC